MARVTVEDCLKQVDSRFALVHLAVRRVLQIRKGSVPLIEVPKNKEVVVALREIAAGKVTLDNIRELEVGPDYFEADLLAETAPEKEAKEVEGPSEEAEEASAPAQTEEAAVGAPEDSSQPVEDQPLPEEPEESPEKAS